MDINIDRNLEFYHADRKAKETKNRRESLEFEQNVVSEALFRLADKIKNAKDKEEQTNLYNLLNTYKTKIEILEKSLQELLETENANEEAKQEIVDDMFGQLEEEK